MDAETGRPVPGIQVLGLPRGKDYPWCSPATTDAQGRFTLALAAPAQYAFLLRWKTVSVVTPSPKDPGYVDIETTPGTPIRGIRLEFLRSAFEKAPR